MRTMNTLMGQDLLSLHDGRRLGSVKDLVVDPQHQQILALVVEEPGLMSPGAVVAAGSIHSFGKDAIVISDASAVRDPESLPEIAAAMTQDGTLVGMKVFSDSGEQQGSVSDVYFDEATSRIVGFQVSQGPLGDVARGPRFLPADQVDHFGDEVIYVRPEVAEGLTAQEGGLQKAAADLGQRAGEAVESARGTVSEMGDSVGQAAESQHAQVEPGQDLLGRRSGADVTAPDGSLVVVTGQRIDEGHLTWAREHDAVDALRAAADEWDAAERDRAISGTVEGVKDAAGSVWDRFMSAVTDMRDASGKRMSEQQTKERLQRINDAVGRPVTKVILDRNDDVILNLGDIITHQAIQRAYEAGLLDTLLDSVYATDVAFERDEMKAPVQATSTVEQASGGAALVDELEQQVAQTEQEKQQAAERSRQEADEARRRREQERADRAAQREETSRAAAEEPVIPPDVPLAVGGTAAAASTGAATTMPSTGGSPVNADAEPSAGSELGIGAALAGRSEEAGLGMGGVASTELRTSEFGTGELANSEFGRGVVDTGELETSELEGSTPGTGEPETNELEYTEPHDGPAEGRQLDLAGADRDESVVDELLGDSDEQGERYPTSG